MVTNMTDHRLRTACLDLASQFPIGGHERTSLIRVAARLRYVYPPTAKVALPKGGGSVPLDDAFRQRAIYYAAAYVKSAFDAAGYPDDQLDDPSALMEEIAALLSGKKFVTQGHVVGWLTGKLKIPLFSPKNWQTLPNLVADWLDSLGYPKRSSNPVGRGVPSDVLKGFVEDLRVFMSNTPIRIKGDFIVISITGFRDYYVAVREDGTNFEVGRNITTKAPSKPHPRWPKKIDLGLIANGDVSTLIREDLNTFYYDDWKSHGAEADRFYAALDAVASNPDFSHLAAGRISEEISALTHLVEARPDQNTGAVRAEIAKLTELYDSIN